MLGFFHTTRSMVLCQGGHGETSESVIDDDVVELSKSEFKSVNPLHENGDSFIVYSRTEGLSRIKSYSMRGYFGVNKNDAY